MSSQRSRPRGSSSNIFINYRREDSSGHAGRLFDALNAHFAGRVFMDIDTLEPGVDFVDVIEQAVGTCEVLLVIIGREWLEIKNAAGKRRLDDPADFVRLELESALHRSIRIIPVLVQGATMPGTEELPPSLARLARRNAIELSDARWAYDVDRLVRTIEEILAEHEGKAPEGVAGAIQAARPRVGLYPLAAAVVVAVLLVLSAVLWMRRTPSGTGAPPEPKVQLPSPAIPKPAPPPAPASDPPQPTREDEPSKPPAKVRTVSKPVLKTPPVEDRPPSAPSKGTTNASPEREKPAPVAPAPPRVTITQPAAGATVGSSVQVQGTIADLGESRAFLCIRQGDGKLYPRGEIFPDADGKWTIQLRSSKEETFDILIVTTSNKPAAQALSDQKYRDNGLADLPQGAFISSGTVAVKRMGKLRSIFAPG